MVQHIGDSSRQAKRRKIDEDASTSSKPFEGITSHNHLRKILSFQGNTSHEVKQGVWHFKGFLGAISEIENKNERVKKLRILKSYCDSQHSTADDEGLASCFPDLIQTWIFAESNNDEPLLSLIPSVLALFLKTTSSQLEFRDFGLDLCKFLLQKEQLKLLNRGLTSSKVKDHLVSPCIRLLTEIVSFDGGALAQIVYAKRDITFKRLDIFLSARKPPAESSIGDRRKPTLRRISQRYVLANFRFQNAAAKEDLIGQGKLLRAFLADIRKDAWDIVVDIIRTLDKYIVSDNSLSRNVKSKFLNRWNLERLVTLYKFEQESHELSSQQESVSNEIHKFFLEICTNSEKGVLLHQTGWYPWGSNPDVLPSDGDDSICLGLDSPIHFGKYKESVPIRNGNLSVLIQFLRPDSDTLQAELLLKIFKAAPELVFDFFSKRTMFTSDPKPTPNWLGESAFLFSTVQLPVPVNFGWKDSLPLVPPPVSVVIESILPRPLTQKILTRCINQNNDIVALFAIRITTLALQKLQIVLKIFRAEHEIGQDLWTQASAKLVGQFCRRCPTMRDVISSFRQTPKDNFLQQDAALKLISMYFQVIPMLAFEENFDISLALVGVLNQLDNTQHSEQDRNLLLGQVEHLLNIAEQSPAIRWWQKPEPLGFSAFTSVLRVLVEATEHDLLEQVKALLQRILVQNAVLLKQSSFDALLESLRGSDCDSLTIKLSFLDNCITRMVKKPVLYLDMVESLATDGQQNLSPLVAGIDEQWPFVVRMGHGEREVIISGWAARLFGLLGELGEDKGALATVRDNMIRSTKSSVSHSLLKKAFRCTNEAINLRRDGPRIVSADIPSQTVNRKTDHMADLSEVFGTFPVEDESHPGLHRWERDDLEVVLQRDYVCDLIFCLCSEHEEVRRQAFANISRFMVKLMASTCADRQPIYVLSGELLETVKEVGFEIPLPFLAGSLAAQMLRVLKNPLHRLYGKVNKFLNKGPRWEIAKIPSYWIDKILLHEPEYDDGHEEEVSWLLDTFIDGLRSSKDMDLYRRANVFERVLSLYNSPALSEPLGKKILHLMFRACEAGGSTTLLTRSGAHSWIQSQIATADHHCNILRKLAQYIYNSCDEAWINRWSGTTLPRVVARISN